MQDSYDVTLTFWPATPLLVSVAQELREVGVDLGKLTVRDGSLAARRTRNGTLVLELSFTQRRFGLSEFEAVLARLRLAGLSYLAVQTQAGRLTGDARAFERVSGIERELTVTAEGEPVLRAGDLARLDGRYDTAQALIEGIQAWLRPPTPHALANIKLQRLTIAVVADEEDDEPGRELGISGGDGE
jgi:hypothetical protein